MSDVEILMNKYQNIKHRGRLENVKLCSAVNETCGDSLSFFVDIDKNGKINNIKYEGLGCALSQVTANELADYLIGKNVKDIEELTFEKTVELIGVKPTPGRVKCIVTSLNALKSLIKDKHKI